jgi:hypothetical protein
MTAAAHDRVGEATDGPPVTQARRRGAAGARWKGLPGRPGWRRPVVLATLAAALAAGGLAAVDASAGIVVGPALNIDATAGVKPISPYIYGVATFGLSTQLAEEMRVPIQRWGGDGVTRYNWEDNTTNSGGDWFYVGGVQNDSSVPSYTPDLDEQGAQQTGGTMLMTIPMIPWISGPAASDCSFPTPPYPPQSWYNWAVTLPDGARCGFDDTAPTISNNWVDTDIAQANVANSPALEQGWVNHLVSKFGRAADGGVAVYEMDNEPGGWSNTHRDVHPHLTGWNELVDDTEAYASAVKTADPSARVDGPGDFAYWDSNGPQGDNSSTHGLPYLAMYYLQQIGDYQSSPAWQDAHPGTRLIDYFDEHYYPSAPPGVSGIGLSPATNAANMQARLDSTCTLWQASCSVDGTTENVGILPIMKSWIAKYDPGIPPAISEYDWGGHESINGALAEADVLGIFGDQGVGLASMWGVPTVTNGVPQPVVFSFEMYRNYDGQGDGFGDTSVQATSGDPANDGANQLSVHAATRSSDGALTVMVVNKTTSNLTSPLSITNFAGARAPGATAQVYTYDADNLDAIVRQPDLDLSAGSATFPADSITLLVIPPAGLHAVAPGAPKLSTVTTANGAATVNFTPPAWDGGSPITSYKVTATDADGTSPPLVGYGSSSPIDVPGLQAGHSYTYVVSATNLAGTSTSAQSGVPAGYDLVGSDGGVFVFPTGQGGYYGSLPGLGVKVDDIVGMVSSADHRGYYLVGADGGVFSFGDTHFENSLPGIGVKVDDIVGIVPSSDDRGYFLVGADGGVFAFGDAHFEGSLLSDGITTSSVVGIAGTPDNQGYWVVLTSGTVYHFGTAGVFGSLTNAPAPVTAITSTPDGGGYWLVTATGGVYPFGDATRFGSLPALGVTPAKRIVTLVPTADLGGYWLIGADGGVFAFGDARAVGSLPGVGVSVSDIVGAVPTRS